ncbi:MAG: TlpA family protein disulfide reductase [Bdellovibrionales bacterium]|nr:TlpA family protein disulfide reductase [Bdellovibrionales bacterium]
MRKNLNTHITLLFFFLGVFLLIGITLTTAHATTIEDQKPNFTIPSITGEEISLNKYGGKVVYLDIWASWCSACRHSLPWMSELQKKYGDQGFQVLAVNVDEDRESAEELLRSSNVDLLVGFDPKGVIPELFEASSMPSSYIIGRDGRILFSHSGINKDSMVEIEREIKKYLLQEDE